MDSLLQVGAASIVIVLFIIGLVGIAIPLLPGILLIWAAILFYAVSVDGWTQITPLIFALITIIGLLAGTADTWLSLFGARKTGASWKTLLLGLIGSVVGTFIVPILGTIAGYAAGILAGEYLRLRDLRAAFRASIGGVVGWGVGTALQLVGAVAMIVIFFLALN